MPVEHPTVRPIARLAMPPAANSTIRARCRSRCSVFVERAKPEAVEKARADYAHHAAEAERIRAELERVR